MGSSLLECYVKMGVFILCILQNQIKTAESGGQDRKIGYIQVGVLTDGSEAVMKGVQIGAVPSREGQLPGKNVVELSGAVQIAAVDMDFLHLGLSNS